MAEPYSDEQLERAVDALSDPERLRGAETVVATAAPGLQKVLVSALQAGGWFEEAHAAEIRKAIELEAADERVAAVRTLMAEEARMGMMVGVAVGWALAEELRTNDTED